jgi:hypothetical protein
LEIVPATDSRPGACALQGKDPAVTSDCIDFGRRP